MRLTAVLRPSAAAESSYSAQASEAIQGRIAQRRSLRLSTVVSSPSAGNARVWIRDISVKGLLIETHQLTVSIDDHLDVRLPDLGIANARVVWMSGPFFGCEFCEPISAGALSAALLKAIPKSLEDVSTNLKDSASLVAGSKARFEPKINLSVAFFLSLSLWALVGLAAYLLAR